MRSVAGSIKYFLPFVILTFMLSACERPLQSDDSTESDEFTSIANATAVVVEQAPALPETAAEETQEETQSGEPDSGLPDLDIETETPDGDQAAAEEQTADSPEAEPTAEVVEATPTPVFQEDIEEEATAVPELEGDAATATAEGTAGTDEEVNAADVAGEESSETGAGDENAAPTKKSPQPTPRTHTVQASDNLYRIGLQYGVTWVAIAEFNNLSYPYFIYAGDVLQIPGGSSAEADEPEAEETAAIVNYVDYTVQFGDTLAKISQQFGVPSEAIIEVNGIINPNLIYAGQILKIPTTSPESQESITHVVQWGETLTLIALQYGVQWLSIAEANGIQPPYVVYAGQTLVIPGG